MGRRRSDSDDRPKKSSKSSKKSSKKRKRPILEGYTLTLDDGVLLRKLKHICYVDDCLAVDICLAVDESYRSCRHILLGSPARERTSSGPRRDGFQPASSVVDGLWVARARAQLRRRSLERAGMRRAKIGPVDAKLVLGRLFGLCRERQGKAWASQAFLPLEIPAAQRSAQASAHAAGVPSAADGGGPPRVLRIHHT